MNIHPFPSEPSGIEFQVVVIPGLECGCQVVTSLDGNPEIRLSPEAEATLAAKAAAVGLPDIADFVTHLIRQELA